MDNSVVSSYVSHGDGGRRAAGGDQGDCAIGCLLNGDGASGEQGLQHLTILEIGGGENTRNDMIQQDRRHRGVVRQKGLSRDTKAGQKRSEGIIGGGKHSKLGRRVGQLVKKTSGLHKQGCTKRGRCL